MVHNSQNITNNANAEIAGMIGEDMVEQLSEILTEKKDCTRTDRKR